MLKEVVEAVTVTVTTFVVVVVVYGTVMVVDGLGRTVVAPVTPMQEQALENSAPLPQSEAYAGTLDGLMVVVVPTASRAWRVTVLVWVVWVVAVLMLVDVACWVCIDPVYTTVVTVVDSVSVSVEYVVDIDV